MRAFAAITKPNAGRRPGEPENNAFWGAGASGLAWRTLTITTLNLTMAFIVWFLVSALVVRLPQIGFKFTPQQLFPDFTTEWAAMLQQMHAGQVPVDEGLD